MPTPPRGALPPPPPPPPPPSVGSPAPSGAGGARRLWARFRARSRVFQVATWVLVGVMVLSLIGALTSPPAVDSGAHVATRRSTTTTATTQPPTTTSTTRPPSSTTTTTTTRPPTTTTRPPTTTTPPPTPAPSGGASTAARAALTQLAQLPVKGRAPKTGYDRAQFGPAWTDHVSVSGGENSCDTRDDILHRDLRQITSRPGDGCVVLSGVLDDPYTGRAIPFVRGPQSGRVQIDHVVALSDAWQKGAQQLSPAQRQNLANDPRNLQATDGPTNEQKGDGDAATWLPPNKAYRCTYVARQVQVKVAYALWVTQAEHDAIARVLSTCGGTPAATATAPPTTAAPRAFAPAPPPPTAPPATAPPTNPAPAPSPRIVHPGAYCAPQGATGVTNRGTPMVCRTTPTDDRARWRSAY